ncbi:MAG: recombinase family protein [Oscillospiraceae bacterium]|nr:recombinase family protein [Oscillospiraceae bacterium]
MTAVIYARYSSDGQREESVEGQLRECKEYAERHNMTIVNTYVDRALSAKTDDRPEFLKMIGDSGRKQFEVILVWKLDRFARNRIDSSTYRAILKRNNVKVASATENISDGPEGIILESILEGMAEYYSAELSVKVKRGQKENALKCKANGGGVPFGYKVNADRYYEIDPLTAPIVLEIFTRYADGQTVNEISADLNSRGVFANTKYKYTNKASMHNLLKNRRYIGEYRYGDIVTPNGMPAIVSEDIFTQVEKRMEKNKHKPAAKKAIVEYMLTTKLFCGNDKTMMVGTSGTSKTGKIHHYYKCGNAIYKRSCSKKAVTKYWIERLVTELVQKFLAEDGAIERLADLVVEYQKRENTTLPFLQKQLNDVEKKINNLLDLMEDGMVNISAKERLDGLETKKQDLEISIAKEKIEKTPLTKEQIMFWISKFKNGDVNNIVYQKEVIDIFVNFVYLDDDKIVIGFNYKDGTKTLLLSELEGEPSSEVLSSYLEQSTPPFTKPAIPMVCRLFTFFVIFKRQRNS